ncbi:MobV family relaxase [Dysgonomonas sp. ZJ279]|uniref:MobV family relaxase n=1 Tax=Dysgonomonas sp. ZJ279 TaxID=2709796 RepID=UPI0013EA5AFE|nr:MobV family relaxase [Dysgonomonas sp. ZJ279]
MGFVVLHLQKAHGTDSATSAHIERTIVPPNADPARLHLNKELVERPEGMNRTQAIQHRLETAGLKRKIGKNQVRAIHINLSGSPEDMLFIQSEGRLEEWCKDNMKWLGDTFGKENIVSAVLHLDETTPHIHATLVPIVVGERRKASAEKQLGKKKYRTKSTDTARLCADDVMTRVKLKEYQDTYALAMQKYGLQRGIDGSEARHTTTQEYYRELFTQKDSIAEKVECLKQEQEEVREKTWDLYDRKDEAREKFLAMDSYLEHKKAEILAVESQLRKVKNDLDPNAVRTDYELACELFPSLEETIRVSKECISVGFSKDQTREMTQGKTVQFIGELYSEEHKRSFKADDVSARIESDPERKNRFRITINGISIAEWFKNLAQKLEHSVRRIVPLKQQPIKGRKR